jgi:phosphoadenosine phosphosulfate reductase
MNGHLQKAITTLDNQFGEDVGNKILPADRPIVMNKTSSLDAMYELVVDGHILGRLRFDIPKRDYTFVLSLEGGRRIGVFSKQKWVTCETGVLPYLKKGANLMLPGVLGCDSKIEKGDEVWVHNEDGMVIAVGIAKMSGEEMSQETKGFAVKIREVGDPQISSINPNQTSWDDVVKANSAALELIETEAISFISRTVEKFKEPVVVGFSGGKDSLVTYLLVEKALESSPPIFFTNTGIELPETVEFIRDFANQRGVKIIGFDAGEAFWDSVDVFGPPARDFRWCCKVLKLGPAAKSIAEEIGGEILTFMGQRKLESFQRSLEPRVSKNPWVPGQRSANPIQRWNALEVWLYIFKEKVTFNPLYNKGYHRMGCYLCPAAPLAELESIRSTHPELYNKWVTTLNKWAEEYGFPEEWADLGFWRWKKLPSGQIQLAKSLNLDIKADRPSPAQNLILNIVGGVSPCADSGFSIQGQFSTGIDINRAVQVLPIFGKIKLWEDLGAVRTTNGNNTLTLFSSGSVTLRGKDTAKLENLAYQVERAMKRALFCQACGSCIPQCEHDALNLDNGQISVDADRCVNCLKCDTWPCPTYLS